jgi:hypothetical protein
VAKHRARMLSPFRLRRLYTALRTDHEALQRTHATVLAQYDDLLQTLIRSGVELPPGHGRQAEWGRARQEAEMEQTTEEIELADLGGVMITRSMP